MIIVKMLVFEDNHAGLTASPSETEPRKEIRYFWDGGLMTNTPLMQLVLKHRWYWYRSRGLKENVLDKDIIIEILAQQDKMKSQRIGMEPSTEIMISPSRIGALKKKAHYY